MGSCLRIIIMNSNMLESWACNGLLSHLPGLTVSECMVAWMLILISWAPQCPLQDVFRWASVPILEHKYKLATILSGGQLAVPVLQCGCKDNLIYLSEGINKILPVRVICSHAPRISLYQSSPCECWYRVSISTSLPFGTRKYTLSMCQLMTSFNSVSNTGIKRNQYDAVEFGNSPARDIMLSLDIIINTEECNE